MYILYLIVYIECNISLYTVYLIQYRKMFREKEREREREREREKEKRGERKYICEGIKEREKNNCTCFRALSYNKKSKLKKS